MRCRTCARYETGVRAGDAAATDARCSGGPGRRVGSLAFGGCADGSYTSRPGQCRRVRVASLCRDRRRSPSPLAGCRDCSRIASGQTGSAILIPRLPNPRQVRAAEPFDSGTPDSGNNQILKHSSRERPPLAQRHRWRAQVAAPAPLPAEIQLCGYPQDRRPVAPLTILHPKGLAPLLRPWRMSPLCAPSCGPSPKRYAGTNGMTVQRACKAAQVQCGYSAE
jgi:hypothetical protein